MPKRKPRKRKKSRRFLRPGPAGWAGSARIVRKEVDPIMRRRGIPKTSAKRRETFGNPSSDHFFLNIFSFAKDYRTANNQRAATEIRRKLEKDSNAQHVDYQEFYIRRWGRTYRVQIIAATHGTGPHLHIGVRRV